MRATENLRAKLPGVLKEFGIRSILDAPCGDFHWMKDFLKGVEVDYTGGDIVRPLVDRSNARFANGRIRFVVLDLTASAFPKADLMICRDCLFHLSFADTRAMIRNFVASDIPYLLTTTHKNPQALPNRDIISGDFRLIDLFSAPFHFPADALARIDDWVAPEPEREMCLWSREQAAMALRRFT